MQSSPADLYTKQWSLLMMGRNYLRPINTQKHEITWSNLGQDAGTAAIKVVLALGKAAGVVTTTTASDITIGSHIKSIYFEFHFSAAQTGNANVIHWQILKEPQDKNPTAPNLYNQSDKRFVFKRGMEMLPTNVSTVFKRVFVTRIPKGYARIGDFDKLTFQYQASSTQTINACGFAIYKEIL